MISSTAIQIPDGDHATFRFHVNADETLLIFAAGAQNDSNNTPADLDSVVEDVGNNDIRYDKNVARDVGDPLVSIEGETDVDCRIENDTGDVQNVNPHFQVSIV